MPYVTSIERRAVEQGLIVGQIQLLQRLLAGVETSREDLLRVPLDQLAQQRDQLQSKFQMSRKND